MKIRAQDGRGFIFSAKIKDMLPQTHRLRARRDIEIVMKKGRNVRGRLAGCKVSYRAEGPSRFAFVVSTKISKRSVVRNLIRRRMLEIVRPLLPAMKQTADVLMMAQWPAKDADFQELKSEITSLLIRTGLLPPIKP